MICSVWTPRAEVGELGRARPEGHDDLLERGVAGALAEAVDRDLDLARAGLDGGERVGRREPEVVVAVDADRRVARRRGRRRCPTSDAELGRDRVADGVGDVDGATRRPRRPPRRPASRKSTSVRRGVLGAELDLGVGPERLAGRSATHSTASASASSRSMPELVLEVDVARRDEHVEVRPLGDPDRLDGPLRVAVAAARERRDRDPPFVSRAIRWTASKSPGEAAGKPASMTSTLSRASWRATSSFSAAVSPAPGACSPSRRVVSKIRTVPARPGRAACAHRVDSATRAPGLARRGLGLAGLDDDRVEERHLARSSRADLLDLVVAVLLRGAARTRRRPASFSAIQRAANEPSWMSARTSFIVARTWSSMIRGPRDVVAVLGGVADAEAHEVEAAAVHQVDDQLELVHRLEVGELGLVAGLDERLEGRLDERRHAAAEHRLLAEQVGLGLLREGRLEDAGAGAAERPGVGEDAGPGVPVASCSTANRAGTPPPAW